jgi:Holliday junction resolvasome RuvABC endonuclease subunit
MTVIGIDPSSRKQAIIVLGKGRPTSEVLDVPTKMKDRASALNWILQHITVIFTEVVEESGDPVYLFIEDPVMGRAGAKATVVQAQAHGVMQAVAIQCGVTSVYSVNNKTWKKDVVGYGNSSKEDVSAWLEREQPGLFRLCAGDQDLIDAACIGLYGQRILRLSAGLSG